MPSSSSGAGNESLRVSSPCGCLLCFRVKEKTKIKRHSRETTFHARKTFHLRHRTCTSRGLFSRVPIYRAVYIFLYVVYVKLRYRPLGTVAFSLRFLFCMTRARKKNVDMLCCSNNSMVIISFLTVRQQL